MNDFVFQTLFTVLGIQYSVLLSSITSFSIDSVINSRYRKAFKARINLVTKKTSILFIIAIIVFIIKQIDFFSDQWITYIDYIILLFMGYCGLYFVISFITLQRLRMDISDRIANEKLEKRNCW